ncbi:MAG TPA: HdeD family acid-resistance protein [Nocardioidaceae bacterium]|nr:HdeD family acid-resistance protein [Nocardioidaceae bacterium]
MSTADVPKTSPADAAPDSVQESLARLGAHWGLLLTLGAAMFVLGLLALAMPGATLLAVAVIVAVQFAVNGVFEIVQAFRSDEAGAGSRTLYGILGALSILVALLVLRDPLRTLLMIGLLLGAWWVVTGIVEVVTAISRGAQADRWWRLAMGVVSLAAGVVVLVQPGISLLVLELVMAIWLMAYGVMAAVAAFALRSHARHHVAPASPPSTEGFATA